MEAGRAERAAERSAEPRPGGAGDERLQEQMEDSRVALSHFSDLLDSYRETRTGTPVPATPSCGSAAHAARGRGGAPHLQDIDEVEQQIYNPQNEKSGHGGGAAGAFRGDGGGAPRRSRKRGDADASKRPRGSDGKHGRPPVAPDEVTERQVLAHFYAEHAPGRVERVAHPREVHGKLDLMWKRLERKYGAGRPSNEEVRRARAGSTSTGTGPGLTRSQMGGGVQGRRTWAGGERRNSWGGGMF